MNNEDKKISSRRSFLAGGALLGTGLLVSAPKALAAPDAKRSQCRHEQRPAGRAVRTGEAHQHDLFRMPSVQHRLRHHVQAAERCNHED